MAQGTFFKSFTSNDRTTSRTLLHEAIPITGALLSGTYNANSDNTRGKNIKSFSHGMFQSVYDYPYLSSSANHVFDVAVGCSTGAGSLSASAVPQIAKKVNIYNQMAQTLVGYDTNGNIREFDADGDFTAGSTRKMRTAIFLNFSRLLTKDEIKKGSFVMKLGTHSYPTASASTLAIKDTGADSSYFINSPAGEYGILYASNDINSAVEAHTGPALHPSITGSIPCGLIYYQAGIAVLTSSLLQVCRSVVTGDNADTLGPIAEGGFLSSSAPGTTGASATTQRIAIALKEKNVTNTSATANHKAKGTVAAPGGVSFQGLFTGSTINDLCDGITNRIVNVSFNNTTELNSTIFFCRANHNEFNYSSNPTYLNNSKIRVKGNQILTPPRSYVTTIGLYSADNELLAVAKLSEPLKKDPSNELTLRVRLDY